MSGLVLIPWAQTDWAQEKRLTADSSPPLNQTGQQQARLWGKEAIEKQVRVVYSSAERTSLDTAEIFAQQASSKVKMFDGMQEVSVGLWEGLTEEELKARFPKVYKRWVEDPSSVCPPEGEELADAQKRIRAVLKKTARKSRKSPFGLVLGPVSCAIARCEIEGTDPWFDQRSFDN